MQNTAVRPVVTTAKDCGQLSVEHWLAYSILPRTEGAACQLLQKKKNKKSLPLNSDADVVQQQLAHDELSRVRERKRVHEDAPELASAEELAVASLPDDTLSCGAQAGDECTSSCRGGTRRAT